MRKQEREKMELWDKVMELERKVDAVPSRAELAQYQRRFVELNEQVSA